MFEQRVRFRPSKTAYTYLGPVFIFTLLLAVGIELIARSSLVQRFIPFQAYGSNHVQYEMQLQNLPVLIEQLALELDFLSQPVQVVLAVPRVSGDLLVAGAVVAERLAKRQVHVQGQRPRDEVFVALDRVLPVCEFVEAFVKAYGRRIRRITRALEPIALYEIGIELGVLHVRLGGAGYRGHSGAKRASPD